MLNMILFTQLHPKGTRLQRVSQQADDPPPKPLYPPTTSRNKTTRTQSKTLGSPGDNSGQLLEVIKTFEP